MGLKVASVWVKYNWVSLARVTIIQWYKDEFGMIFDPRDSTHTLITGPVKLDPFTYSI
jgi:hypothetical protein